MKKALKCELCKEEFDSTEKLNDHTEYEHKKVSGSRKKNFKCNMCGHEFINRRNLSNHLRTHTGERPFKCKVSACGMEFKQESSLMCHTTYKHSNKRPLKCDFPDCLKTFKTSTCLISHKKMHSDELPFACPYPGCTFRSKRKPSLTRHSANVHSEYKSCTFSKCNFKTKYSTSLAHHAIVHDSKNEKFPCSKEGCEYKGKNTLALVAHMRLHKRLFPCPISGCGRYIHTKEALKDHVKRHKPSGRPFQCPLCFQHYGRVEVLQLHCFVHTNEKPFQCGHCEYAAPRQDCVRAHICSGHPAIEFPFIVHLLHDRECVHCKVILPTTEFLDHCKDHLNPVVKK